MAEFSYKETTFGVLGTLPCGEEMEFGSVEEYRLAYDNEVNDIIDELAELEDELIDYPDDYMYA